MTKIINHVEMLCKNLFKTLCNFCEPFCGFFYDSYKKCEQLHFPTKFFRFSHLFIHISPTPANHLSFTHLHIPYYNYYKIIN